MFGQSLLRRGLRPIVRAARSTGTAWQKFLAPAKLRRAKRHRQTLCAHYIAVTGSCGKSTATMLAGELLGAQRPAAVGAFRNYQYDSIRWLRRLNRRVDYFVQEASEFPFGALDTLARNFAPDAAAVTAIGLDHFSAFRSIGRVREEIEALVRRLPASGFVCLNADDPEVAKLASQSSARVILFGRAAASEVRAENIEPQLPRRLSFDLVIGNTRRRVQTAFAGTLLLPSILAALAIVHGYGLDLDRAVADLARIEPQRKRMAIHWNDAGHSYLLDTQKAPLWSTWRLIEDIPNLSAGRRIFVLGDMSDTMNDSRRRYRQTLTAAAEHCALVIGIGQSASQAGKLVGLRPDLRIVPADDLATLRAILEKEPPSLVIVKGREVPLTLADVATTSAPPAPQALPI